MILITGASSGLGAALAKQYARDKIALTLTGRHEERLHAVAQQCQPANICTLAADLADPQAVTQLFDHLPHAPKSIIFCTGSGYFGPIEKQEPDAIAQLVQNNLLSASYFLHEVVKRYRNTPLTCAVVMSTAAQSAKAGESTYCAVKWGVRGLVESVRLELKGKPMKLVGVYPGGMATEFWATSGETMDTREWMTPDETATMLRNALQQAQHGYISEITISRNELF
ncbi:SDR family NAD(P)-dependent oxidoreductase [Photobacterium sp. 1_MG-2023]|uniref:SDR family NAD(P)-dependent oxidoreductase n=1 Tax=Photobacterium sp. 1_MG-2023 TaxID=3062646 RepID=UPI0026E2CBCC|nr:SDR family NAD(P)-dependent oxidoreductase [Photobacterium sp. 1_MG-2023]MDO6707504.1 SDR family NAD(P)-dependent oxidoreductase [Photobacterium sp. 1_MG-2023]